MIIVIFFICGYYWLIIIISEFSWKVVHCVTFNKPRTPTDVQKRPPVHHLPNCKSFIFLGRRLILCNELGMKIHYDKTCKSFIIIARMNDQRKCRKPSTVYYAPRNYRIFSYLFAGQWILFIRNRKLRNAFDVPATLMHTTKRDLY